MKMIHGAALHAFSKRSRIPQDLVLGDVVVLAPTAERERGDVQSPCPDPAFL
jgi:hypothetical protein